MSNLLLVISLMSLGRDVLWNVCHIFPPSGGIIIRKTNDKGLKTLSIINYKFLGWN